MYGPPQPARRKQKGMRCWILKHELIYWHPILEGQPKAQYVPKIATMPPTPSSSSMVDDGLFSCL